MEEGYKQSIVISCQKCQYLSTKFDTKKQNKQKNNLEQYPALLDLFDWQLTSFYCSHMCLCECAMWPGGFEHCYTHEYRVCCALYFISNCNNVVFWYFTEFKSLKWIITKHLQNKATWEHSWKNIIAMDFQGQERTRNRRGRISPNWKKMKKEIV